MGKTGRKNRKYSAEFKISVIMDMWEQHLAYRETVRRHWGTTSRSEEDKYLRTLKAWERIYLTEGADGLMTEKLSSTANRKQKDCPPKLDKKLEEALIAENRQLKMEIEYLKKLSALVLAEERKNGKKH